MSIGSDKSVAIREPEGDIEREQAISLLTKHVGDYFFGALDAPSTQLLVAVDQAGQLAGAAIGTELEDADRAHMLKQLRGVHFKSPARRSFVERLEYELHVGNLYALAVDPQYRGRGVGRHLVDARLEGFRAAGMHLAVAESWVREDEPSSVPLYESMQFLRIADVPRYWMAQDQSQARSGDSCPVCGAFCSCSGIVFAKEI